MCSHGHGGGPCSELNDASNFVQHQEGMIYNMEKYIIKEKVIVLNEATEGAGVKVFKAWDERLDKTHFVQSDVDEELLFCVPFSGNVKLTGITFAGPLDMSFPSRVKLFKDRENMSFDDCQVGRPDQEMALKQDDCASIDYPLDHTKFSSVGHLTLHFPNNFGDPKTMLYYIGLRGEFQSQFRERIVIATYEARPVPDDHKVDQRDPVNHQGPTKRGKIRRKRNKSVHCSDDN